MTFPFPFFWQKLASRAHFQGQHRPAFPSFLRFERAVLEPALDFVGEPLVDFRSSVQLEL